MNRRLPLSGCAALALAAPLLLGACEYEGASSLPLPGALGKDDGYAVTVTFVDAANLVEKETCRTHDTVIGSVESIELTEELQAEVVCRIRHDVELPENVTASVRQTSLLGERFVSFDVLGAQPARGALEDGAMVPAARTRVDPDTELVLGALSQVLNGGGLANIQTITRELTTALSGSDTAGTLRALRRFVGTVNENKDSITATLDALDRFSGRLVEQRGVIAGALESIPDGLAVLDRERPQLVATLRKLRDLSRTAVPLIDQVKADTLADLRHLTPVLSELTEAGDEIARTIERVVSFPLPSSSLSVIKGDYGGMYATVSLDLEALQHLLPAPPAGETDGSTGETPVAPPTTGLILPDVLALVPTGGGFDQLLGGLLGGAR